MNRLARYFVNGLILSTPIAVTLYVCWRLFRAVDGWLNLPWHGAGFVVTVALITLVGWLATTFLWNTLFGLVERAMDRLPLVRFLYNSLKEVLGAFVGEKKRFDRPVMVSLAPGGSAHALGFLTRESLDSLGLPGLVAVYLPQSYNFAGQVLLFPASQVTPLTGAVSSDVMAFIVSGGVVEGAERGSEAPASPAR